MALDRVAEEIGYFIGYLKMRTDYDRMFPTVSSMPLKGSDGNDHGPEVVTYGAVAAPQEVKFIAPTSDSVFNQSDGPSSAEVFSSGSSQNGLAEDSKPVGPVYSGGSSATVDGKAGRTDDEVGGGTGTGSGYGGLDPHYEAYGYQGQYNDVPQLGLTIHQTIIAGGNELTNIAELHDMSEGYDLIIVGGHYYEFNTIFQINFLSDNDTIEQSSSLTGENGGFGDGAAVMQLSDAGGNVLINIATIVDYNNLTDMVVGGGYYELNTVIQINILWDEDTIIDHASVYGDGSGEPAIYQMVDAGGNTLMNKGEIVDDDSGTAYQYFGGGYYEYNIETGFDDLIDMLMDFDFENASVDQILHFLEWLGQALHYELAEMAQAYSSEVDVMDVSFADEMIDDYEHVLKVSGDLYDYDTVIQTNLLLDDDVLNNTAVAESQGNGEEDGEVTPTSIGQGTYSGENAATNEATVVDDEAGSGYETYHDDYYDDDTIYQTNLINDEDKVDQSATSEEDQVAAYMDGESAAESAGYGADGETAGAMHSTDILSSYLG
ncbi:MAG: hypothetical protein QNJ92_00010 [Alphaproteobacteria bacterium]|nr:hypothetical protein [Alphaproteobacteria bacterium]